MNKQSYDPILPPLPQVTRGRKVFEVRPALAWDKGQALSYLMEAFGAAAREGVMPLYIGDDKTDEDAFT